MDDRHELMYELVYMANGILDSEDLPLNILRDTLLATYNLDGTPDAILVAHQTGSILRQNKISRVTKKKSVSDT